MSRRRTPAKTLHLTNAYHPSSGGIRTFYRALLESANLHGRLMRLVVPGAVDDCEEVGRFGRIYYVRSSPAPIFDRRYRVMLPSAYLPVSRGAVIAILEREQPDLVEICDKYSLFYLAALLRKNWAPAVRRPVLVGASFERMDDNLRAYVGGGRLSNRFTRWYLRHIYGPPFDYHIANSSYTADELRQALWDRAPDFIQVRPMGVDAERYGPQHRDELLRCSLLERAGGRPDSVLLLYVGRLSPEKNVGLLVETLERLVRSAAAGQARADDFRLVIVGEGPLRASLESAAARLTPGRVLMLGASEGATLARYFASADVFLHPNAHEPFGIAPLEAMASGVSVVVPNAGGMLGYANPDNAVLAAPKPEAFALAVRSVVDTPCRLRIAAARRTAEAHDWPQVASRWFSTYDALISSRRLSPGRIASPSFHDTGGETCGLVPDTGGVDRAQWTRGTVADADVGRIARRSVHRA